MSTDTLLEFPCEFPIKAFGRADADTSTETFADLVYELIQPHAGELMREALRINSSRNGRFIAITATIIARSQAQLDAIYQCLSDHEKVVMSL